MAEVDAILRATSALLAGIHLLAGITIQAIENPKKQYEDDVQDLQEDRWDVVSNELADVVVDEIMSTIKHDGSDYKQEDLDTTAKASVLIRQTLEPDRLDTVATALRDVREPREIYEECRACWRKAFYGVMVAFGASAPAVVLSFTLPNNTWAINLASGLIAIGIASSIYVIYRTHRILETKRQLDSMVDDLNFM
ncbi:hypothetical protein [Halostella litorea]|uniref:hypothetical protein n=1 Tax=Halostella litorea TaxID=2528831 RepID=UPI0010924483|nr:hypothetical protein [Halostella litorea]